MLSSDRHKEAGYEEKDLEEITYIGLLTSWISATKKAVPFLFAGDKVPNKDGYIDLLDKNRKVKGEIRVQVKKIQDINVDKPKYTFTDDGKFFNYCRKRSGLLPIILIGFDLVNTKAYWIHMTKDYVNSLGKKKTVSFKIENIIEENSDQYISGWNTILDEYLGREDEIAKSYKLMQHILRADSLKYSLSSESLVNIHNFLKKYNDLSNKEFRRVKQVYYMDYWEVGFAFHDYDEDKVSYALYPFSIEEGGESIKKIDKEVCKDIFDWGFDYATKSFKENPIEKNPEKEARKIIEKRVLEVLKRKRLLHSGNVFVASEWIFAILDEIDRDRNFNLSIVGRLPRPKASFFNFKAANKFDVNYLLNKFQNHINRERVGFEDCDTKIETISVGDIDRPYALFEESITYLHSEKVKEIERAYIQPDLSRKPGPGGIRSFYTKSEVKSNLERFFKELPIAYENLVKTNFPLLERELAIFDQNRLMVICYSLDKLHDSFPFGPIYKMFQVELGKNVNLESNVLFIEERDEKIRPICFGTEEIEIEGRKYQSSTVCHSTLDFLFQEMPMINFIYKLLTRNMKQYFRDILTTGSENF